MQISDLKRFAVGCRIGIVVSWILLLSTSVAGWNDYENIPKSYIDEITQAFERGGTAAVETLIFDHLNEWKNIDINIAVTGSSGVGKSSFINALRGLSAEDKGAAEVGVIETTVNRKKYPHPANERLVLWDLPGVGTPTFLRENYLEAIQAPQYDYFIIISSDRFTENDLWLANSLLKRNKAFYFVRTKIGQDIENDKTSHPKTHKPENVINSIRENCRMNLEKHGITGNNARLFLIDNYNTQEYDFSLLSARLLADAPELKKKAMIYSMNVLSKSLIRSKKEVLLERARNVAMASGIAAAIPIPGLDVLVDIFLMLDEARFYRAQFGVDDNSLQKVAYKFGKSVGELHTSLNLKSRAIEFTAEGLLRYFSKTGIKMTTSRIASTVLKFIPILGSILNFGISYSVTLNCMEHLLEVIVEDALKLNTIT